MNNVITKRYFKSIYLTLFFIFGIQSVYAKEEIIIPNYRVELRDISVCIGIDTFLAKHHDSISKIDNIITGYDLLASYEREKMRFLEKIKNEIIIPILLNKNENKDTINIMASTVLMNTMDKLDKLSEVIKIKDLMIISDDCEVRYIKLNTEYTY